MVFVYADEAFRLLLSLVKTIRFAVLSKPHQTICFQQGNEQTDNGKEECFFAILNVQLSQ
jgi:hypothetical protein